MKYVFVAGKKQAGKDVFIDEGMDTPVLKIAKFALADPLKEEVAAFIKMNAGDPDDFWNYLVSMCRYSDLKWGHWVPKIQKEIEQVTSFKELRTMTYEQILALLHDVDIKDRGFRSLCQFWGTEYRRRQDPYYWTKLWSDIVAVRYKDGDYIATPGIRFPSEIELGQSLNAIMVRVKRPETDKLCGDHASENALDHMPDSDFHIVMNNVHDLETYKSECRDAWSIIFNDDIKGK